MEGAAAAAPSRNLDALPQGSISIGANSPSGPGRRGAQEQSADAIPPLWQYFSRLQKRQTSPFLPPKGANHCPYGYLPANRRLLKGRRRGQQGAFLSLAGGVLFTQTPASFACLDAPLGATAALLSITWP